MRILDLGRLIPPALTTQRLAALGADVVKVATSLDGGDYLDRVGPFTLGRSPMHMNLNAGKRSVYFDVEEPEQALQLQALFRHADVIVENAAPGSWLRAGVDFEVLRKEIPTLVICSVSGFGRTGPWAGTPSHGFNIDAAADTLRVELVDGKSEIGWMYHSPALELGSHQAALAICAALLHVRTGGQGVWIDMSCWDAAVESHRDELSVNVVTGHPFNKHDLRRGDKYNVYLSSDGKPVLLGALEQKFWSRFCAGIRRPDLLDRGDGNEVENLGRDPELRAILTEVIASVSATEWEARFREWRIPGGRVLSIDEVMRTEHFKARRLLEDRANGEYPIVSTPIRWHDHGGRAGDGLGLPPDSHLDRSTLLREWQKFA